MLEKCPVCGTPVQERDTVCSNCGADLIANTQQGDATQPMAGAAGQAGGYTHKLSESEKNMTFGKVETAGPAKGQGGKDNRRSVLGILVCLLTVALAMALATMFQMNKRLSELESTAGEGQVQAGSEGSDDGSITEEPKVDDGGNDAQNDAVAQEDGEEPTDGAVSEDEPVGESPSEPAKKKKYHGLIGTWTGTLQPTDRRAYCYGAEKMPMVIKVKDVADTGMITADMKVCFHGHGGIDNSAASTEGDTYLEFKDLALTYSNGRIIYDIEKLNQYAGITCMLYVQLDITDIDSESPQMTGLVLGTYDLWSYEKNGTGHSEDRYVFEKS